MKINNLDLSVAQATFVCMMSLCSFGSAAAQQKQMVRLAKLVIDSAQLESYNRFLKEEIEASVRLEPGVITLYAVAEKAKPNHITILEIYANHDAYKAHVQTTDFLKYKNATKDMVKSLELTEAVPLVPENEDKVIVSLFAARKLAGLMTEEYLCSVL